MTSLTPAGLYNGVHTALSNQNSRIFPGFLRTISHFSRTKNCRGSAVFSWIHISPLYKIQVTAQEKQYTPQKLHEVGHPTESQGLNTHEGGDLRRNCQITLQYELHVIHSHCHIN